jgi:hypothetical protein
VREGLRTRLPFGGVQLLAELLRTRDQQLGVASEYELAGPAALRRSDGKVRADSSWLAGRQDEASARAQGFRIST